MNLLEDRRSWNCPPPRGRSGVLWLIHACMMLTLAAVEPENPGAKIITFNEQLAPVMFQHCSPCHHPGAPGPFPLLSYQDARKHAEQIADLTSRRLMPPWLPEPGHGDFLETRRLSDAEAALFTRWLKDGKLEGPASALPPAPVYPDGWRLGPPDLVAELPEPFELGPEGPDLYRNFVLPLALTSNRFVRTFEFQPGSSAVHHARIMLDSTGEARERDRRDAEPGFDGMKVDARYPPGHLLTWAPGRQPWRGKEELSWLLEAGSDVVVQLHLQRTGKRERVQPRIGFYFTDQPPGKTPFLAGMTAQVIDIPPGATNYTVSRSFTLPAEVELLSVMPHAHYLGKEVVFDATLPDGTTCPLLWIKHWDFNWQDEYRYAKPVVLPAGTRLNFRLSFDNSTNNARNPNQPPKRVVHGPQSTDEMAELWLQMLPRSPAGLAALQKAYRRFSLEETVAHFEDMLKHDPKLPRAQLELGKALGALNRKEEAFNHLLDALELDPKYVEAYHYVGLYFLEIRQWPEAREAFQTAVNLDPKFQRSHTGLGLAALGEGRLEDAQKHLARALELNPGDTAVRRKLEELRAATKH